MCSFTLLHWLQMLRQDHPQNKKPTKATFYFLMTKNSHIPRHLSALYNEWQQKYDNFLVLRYENNDIIDINNVQLERNEKKEISVNENAISNIDDGESTHLVTPPTTEQERQNFQSSQKTSERRNFDVFRFDPE